MERKEERNEKVSIVFNMSSKHGNELLISLMKETQQQNNLCTVFKMYTSVFVEKRDGNGCVYFMSE